MQEKNWNKSTGKKKRRNKNGRKKRGESKSKVENIINISMLCKLLTFLKQILPLTDFIEHTLKLKIHINTCTYTYAMYIKYIYTRTHTLTHKHMHIDKVAYSKVK